MATRAAIKAYFQTGDVPTQAEYEEFFDSIPFLEETSLILSSANNFTNIIQVNNTDTDGRSSLSASADDGDVGCDFGVGGSTASTRTSEIYIEGWGASKISMSIDGTDLFIIASTGAVDYADNAAAVAAGLAVGTIYRTGDTLKIVH